MFSSLFVFSPYQDGRQEEQEATRPWSFSRSGSWSVASRSRPQLQAGGLLGNRPTLWFAQAEGNFELYGETSSRRKFFRVLNALPEDITRQVADLIEQVPDDNPYELLKGRLLGAAKVSNFQRAEKLMALPALGDRKPSDLLATMLEVCPRGWEKENFFHFPLHV